MIQLILLFALSLSSTVSFANPPIADGLCQYVPGEGGLLKAVCSLPNCPTGGDCVAPTVLVSNAKVEYFEPLIQWKDSCPNPNAGTSCWEVYMDFKILFGAQDPNGVNLIGASVMQEVDGKKAVKKFWTKAVKKDSDPRYEMLGGVVAYSPAGKAIQLSINELCAKDNLGNEGCFPIGNAVTNAVSSRQLDVVPR